MMQWKLGFLDTVHALFLRLFVTWVYFMCSTRIQHFTHYSGYVSVLKENHLCQLPTDLDNEEKVSELIKMKSQYQNTVQTSALCVASCYVLSVSNWIWNRGEGGT